MTNIKTDFKRVTNLDYLLTLSKGNTQFVKEMIGIFLIENPKEIESLEKAIQNKDFEAIRQAAHLLQSSIPFVGLNKIIEKEVYEIEKIATDRLPIQNNEIPKTDRPDIQKMSLLFSQVKETCEKACKELSKQEHLRQSTSDI